MPLRDLPVAVERASVARIKTVLKNEGLIASDYVRPPQMGITEAERTELLRRYAELRGW